MTGSKNRLTPDPMSTITSHPDWIIKWADLHPQSGWRKDLLSALSVTGLPSGKHEEYRFTPVMRQVEKYADRLIINPTDDKPDAPLPVIPGTDIRISLYNGLPTVPDTIPQDLYMAVQQITEPEEADDAFAALNLLMASSRLVIRSLSDRNPVVHLHHITGHSSGPVMINPCIRIELEPRASLTVMETFSVAGSDFNFMNSKLDVHVGEGAVFHHISIQNCRHEGVQLHNNRIRLGSESVVHDFVLSTEGALIRNNSSFMLEGSRSEANLHGLYLLGGKTIADNHTVVDHRVPDANSNELYKGVMAGQSRGVFNGKIFVRPDAQRTNAFQSNRNILLSDSATVNTKPQLEIWADDVKCSHGCTSGNLDEEALFYLLSRGIPKSDAQAMLLDAFASEAIDKIGQPVLREWIRSIALNKIQALH